MLRMRTLQEGSVGLFAILGLIIFGGLVVWLRGGILGQKTYQILADFKDVNRNFFYRFANSYRIEGSN